MIPFGGILLVPGIQELEWQPETFVYSTYPRPENIKLFEWRDPFVDSKKIPKMVYQNFQTKMCWWIFLG